MHHQHFPTPPLQTAAAVRPLPVNVQRALLVRRKPDTPLIRRPSGKQVFRPLKGEPSQRVPSEVVEPDRTAADVKGYAMTVGGDARGGRSLQLRRWKRYWDDRGKRGLSPVPATWNPRSIYDVCYVKR
jgi:hypothetical protein